MAQTILEAVDLVKKYGDHVAVDCISFTIQEGEVFGLLGPNGAGKTTTLRMLLGLIAPDAGTATLLDLPVPQAAREARIRVGVVPQMDNLDPDFSVRENLLAYGRYFGMDKAAIAARVPELLEFAGLASKGDAQISQLSGGMKRRLTLARALVHDPDILFLDEPTTGLDPQARHLIWQGLRRLIAEGKTIVLTTHFMDEAERLTDRLAILDHGSIVAEGAPRLAYHVRLRTAAIHLGPHRSPQPGLQGESRCCNCSAVESSEETVPGRGEMPLSHSVVPRRHIDAIIPTSMRA